MIKKLIYLVLVLSSASTWAVELPTITNSQTKKELKLNDEALKVLKKWNPQFEVYHISDYAQTVMELFQATKNELPMAVIGDFDADKKDDIALMGADRKKEYSVILLQRDRSFEIFVARETEKPSLEKNQLVSSEGDMQVGLSQYLGLESAENYKEIKDLKSNQKLLQIEEFGGSSSLYYLKSNPKTKKLEIGEYH